MGLGGGGGTGRRGRRKQVGRFGGAGRRKKMEPRGGWIGRWGPPARGRVPQPPPPPPPARPPAALTGPGGAAPSDIGTPLLESAAPLSEPKSVQLGFVAGTITNDKLAPFERLLFRATRGNVFLRSNAVRRGIGSDGAAAGFLYGFGRGRRRRGWLEGRLPIEDRKGSSWALGAAAERRGLRSSPPPARPPLSSRWARWPTRRRVLAWTRACLWSSSRGSAPSRRSSRCAGGGVGVMVRGQWGVGRASKGFAGASEGSRA